MHNQYGDKALECDFHPKPTSIYAQFSLSNTSVQVILKLVEHGARHSGVTSRDLLCIQIWFQNAKETKILGVRYRHGAYPSL